MRAGQVAGVEGGGYERLDREGMAASQGGATEASSR